VHDGLTLERRGVPTAVICTEPFVTSADAMAALGGVPDYPYVVVPHPLGSRTMAQIREIAARATPDVLGILLAQR
jgi:hypothetical protein